MTTKKQKVHWATTPAGRRKIRADMKRLWAERRARKATYETVAKRLTEEARLRLTPGTPTQLCEQIWELTKSQDVEIAAAAKALLRLLL